MLNLSGLKKYLKDHRVVTLNGLARTFNEEPQFIQSLLEHFIRKGCLRNRPMSGKCGITCNKCQFSDIVAYEWVES